MNPFSHRGRYSFLASGLIAIILAAAAVVLPSWNALFPFRIWHVFAVHLTISSAIFAASFAVLWQFCGILFGVYNCPNESWLVSVPRSAACSGTMTAFLALHLITLRPEPPVTKVLFSFLLCAILCELLRLSITGSLRKHKHRAIIIGSGRLAAKAWKEFRVRPGGEVSLVGFVDHGSSADMCPDIAARYLGGVENLSSIILENAVDDIIVATPLSVNSTVPEHATLVAGALGARILCLKDACGIRQEGMARDDEDVFFELVPAARLQGVRQAAKRAFDVAVSVAVLLTGLPVLLAAAILAASRGRGLVFESEVKFGFRRKQYRTYVVRSAPGSPLFQLCLARLPLMWNVLRGEMSLVGPPPLSANDISQVEINAHFGRFKVRPGLTGSIDFKEITQPGPIGSDGSTEYSESWSLQADLKILTRAFRIVVQRTGMVETGAGVL